ncbi:L-2-amino-thiazoline-4-carboxylic acid hydrolase [Curtanaerobium respiraculi]|uniref:L-2-amino-thiazoline-4-carboxylic acid hydrolase n=1 Tax=Curtanaerobium respiraculi TaxID=2949669 RepID=UPI0024B3925A|nr:L-2-amino-thiazoline-4-carboxylic acid hydrolase [Curtanaerobium respiraculi]
MAKKQRLYEGHELVAASRWQEHLPTIPEADRDRIVARVDELVADNREYCDEGNYNHLANIFTALALYEIERERGLSEDEAVEAVGRPMWDFVEKHTAGMYRKLLSKPGMLKLADRIVPAGFEKGSGQGWEYVWHHDKSTAKRLQFECTSCIYAQIYGKYGVRRLGTIFCHADDVNYGSIPGVTFTREHTLCKDGQPCDFLFTK